MGEKGFPGGTVVKNLPTNTGDAKNVGLIPGSGRSPGVGNGNPLQYSHLENSERDGNTRPPDLPLEKSVYRSRSNS